MHVLNKKCSITKKFCIVHWFKLLEFEDYNHKTTYACPEQVWKVFFPFHYKSGLVWLLPIKKKKTMLMLKKSYA